MKLFKRIKDRKGLVIETAVIFMVAIFSFCFLLSTLTVTGHNRAKVEKIKLEQSVAVERIVDEYILFLSTLTIPEVTTDTKDNAENNDPSNAENQASVDAEPVDISYEYPLLSPLDNEAEGEAGSSDTTAAPETTADPIPSFVGYMADPNNTKYFAFMPSGYSAIDSHYRDKSDKNKMYFELSIYAGENLVYFAKFSKIGNAPAVLESSTSIDN